MARQKKQAADLSAVESKLHSGPEAANRFLDFTTRILAVPKTEIDKRIAAEKQQKERRKKVA